MKSALSRELSAARWRLCGAVLGLLLIASGLYLWGHHVERSVERHVEHRIDRIVIQGGKDRKRIAALEDGHAATGGGDALQTPHHSAHQQPGPQTGGQPASAVREEPAPLPAPLPKTVESVEGAANGAAETIKGVVCSQTALLCE